MPVSDDSGTCLERMGCRQMACVIEWSGIDYCHGRRLLVSKYCSYVRTQTDYSVVLGNGGNRSPTLKTIYLLVCRVQSRRNGKMMT